ncbi:chemotaxis-specific protein-glutamate methyltransferase CheB [Nitrosovibrio sp. Nv17]|uniref:chemotaxis-specific protein-glutamate methyltransferase CheB n=1 Tax=Nitrosovibrio sp. Nv17 TaxID=1855339 RepID=UPI000908B170|nr:chemotaxis-specific protein-glutamate methyltransferase CheB [Nitrosovibrio sp. Nv17]SFW30497.1 two-component system, chemotaxis family, response regulator CheB [Nitrosovibrio sp. Nv17]
MINVLVVEDSPTVRELLVHILGSDPGIAVVATARDGEEALDLVRQHRPDVVTMDIHMPRLNGLEATRAIMETHPTPIVIVSSSENIHEVATTFDAMNAGALAVLRRPAGLGHPEHRSTAEDLIRTVRLISEIKLVRRWPQLRETAPLPRRDADPLDPPEQIRVIGLGASTGGPSALEVILRALPGNFSLPILIVQHMTAGFVQGFVQWLAGSCSLPLHVPLHGDPILPGHVYIAPDDCQMKVEHGGRIALTQDEREHGLRPSVSYLFRSIATVYGRTAAAGLLTGMGRDGADALRLLRESGALTFAQDRETSVVDGMPGEAIRLNAARFVMPLGRIAPLLLNLNRQNNGAWAHS